MGSPHRKKEFPLKMARKKGELMLVMMIRASSTSFFENDLRSGP